MQIVIGEFLEGQSERETRILEQGAGQRTHLLLKVVWRAFRTSRASRLVIPARTKCSHPRPESDVLKYEQVVLIDCIDVTLHQCVM